MGGSKGPDTPKTVVIPLRAAKELAYGREDVEGGCDCRHNGNVEESDLKLANPSNPCWLEPEESDLKLPNPPNPRWLEPLLMVW